MSNEFVELNQNSSLTSAYAGLYDDNLPIQKTLAFDRSYDNHFGKGHSVKSEYLRQDYEYFRQNSSRPKTRENILKACQNAYDRVGVVRQVIDLMSDFGSKGVRIRHENPAVERFCQRWWEKVQGPLVSERFFNQLYRLGTVPVYRTYAKINSDSEKRMKSVKGNQQDKKEVKFNKYDPFVIPIRYNLLNPVLVDVFAKELSNFIGENIYIMRIKTNITDITVPFNIGNKKEMLDSLIKT